MTHVWLVEQYDLFCFTEVSGLHNVEKDDSPLFPRNGVDGLYFHFSSRRYWHVFLGRTHLNYAELLRYISYLVLSLYDILLA